MKVLNWGLIEYQEALKRQKDLVDQRIKNEIENTLVFCSHPCVVTLGRSQHSKKDILHWDGPVFNVERGGRATYHSPYQILIYPIFSLNFKNATVPSQDIKAYLNALECVLISSLKHIGVFAKSHSQKNNEDKKRHWTGVWVGDKKIASMGIAIKNWVSYHGISLNWDQEKEAFKGISPCGFSSTIMTCVEEVLNEKKDRKDFIDILTLEFKNFFNHQN